MTDNNDDGVALQSADHPIEVTDAMLDAGERVLHLPTAAATTTRATLHAVFIAMCRAAPPLPEDLNEESLEQAVVAIRLHDNVVERFAIRCIEACQGGRKLPPGFLYPDQRIEPVRQLVRELAAEIYAAPRQMRLFTDEPDDQQGADPRER